MAGKCPLQLRQRLDRFCELIKVYYNLVEFTNFIFSRNYCYDLNKMLLNKKTKSKKKLNEQLSVLFLP